MLKKAFYALIMGVEGVAALAMGAFALAVSGKWTMECFDEGEQRVRQFIRRKTSDPVITEEAKNETDGE